MLLHVEFKNREGKYCEVIVYQEEDSKRVIHHRYIDGEVTEYFI